jgi:hypothetical protein
MKTLTLALFCLILSACALAQDTKIDEHYTITGDGACDTVLTLTSESALDVAVRDDRQDWLDGTNLFPGDVWETRLPTGRADYDLAVEHDAGAQWSYDLRVECPITPSPDETEEAHGIGESLTQRGLDPASGRVVTAIPVRVSPGPPATPTP